MIKVIYNKVCGRCVQSEPLTSGMVGQPIHFEYSHDFDGLAVTAVFTDGKNTVDVVNPGNECIIPHEVLTTVGAIVKVGIYAVRGNEIVIPTVYANIGVVQKGADPSGDVSIDPTLPIWAQTQALIGNLSQIETETKDSLVAAINEVKQTADRKANAADLAPVATSGSYNDLSDKPTIPSVPMATIEANTAARHTHNNKTLLDSITEAVKTAWNTASEWVITNGANVLSHLSDGVKHITAAERTKWNDKQDKLIAGDNITIAADGKTISATGGGGGGSTVELDTTLSETGKAADAKAVGDALAGKQNTISDLEAIRSGAAKGATALQSVPNTYRTASEQDTIDSGKVDKVTGKGLSTNDYTDAAKAKVDALAPVATSGSYNDLTNKPTIPTALPNPHKLTINGTEYDGSTEVQIAIEGGGGSAETFELIKYIKTTESVNEIRINADDIGDPFELKEVQIYTQLYFQDNAGYNVALRLHSSVNGSTTNYNWPFIAISPNVKSNTSSNYPAAYAGHFKPKDYTIDNKKYWVADTWSMSTIGTGYAAGAVNRIDFLATGAYETHVMDAVRCIMINANNGTVQIGANSKIWILGKRGKVT